MITFKKYLLDRKIIVISVFILSIFFIAFNLFFISHYTPYTSDDVSWQVILQSWSITNKHIAFLGGSDNYILRAPIIYLMNHVFGFSRKSAFLESLIFEIITLSLYLFSVLYFLKEFKPKNLKLSLLPILWISSFGFSFSIIFMNSNLRSFELGFSFLVFAFLLYLFKKEKKSVSLKFDNIIFLLISILSGLLIFNDPYYLYFTIVPIFLFGLFCFYIKKIDLKFFFKIFLFVFISFAINLITKSIVNHINIIIPYQEPVRFVGFNSLSGNITTGLKGLLIIFGANFFGSNVLSVSSVDAIINFVLLFIILISIILNIKHKTFTSDNIWKLFFGVLGIFIFLVYILSNFIIDISTYRYLIMLVMAFVLYFSLTINDYGKEFKKILVILICSSIFLNLLLSIQQYRSLPLTTHNLSNNVNFNTIKKLRKLGLKKGYTSYWDGDINTFLSKGKIQFLPIYCSGKKTIPFYWLVDSNKYKMRVNSSFILIDPSFTSPPLCSLNDIFNQFGKPLNIVSIDKEKILIYNYDVATKM